VCWALQCAELAIIFVFPHVSFSTHHFALQVMTGESWSEAVARPTIFGDSAMGSGVFYITFIIATQIVLVNVRWKSVPHLTYVASIH
jgi:hypothetical protein